ncbi:MAG: hypothetical protein LBK61_08770 [Spirochaetaceae bacterium]|nr:hypothetical protein [Spirochaetaceae bacterium]
MRFAEDVNRSLAFTSSMGLNWSVPYMGELFGPPAHLGAGIAMTGTFMNSAETAALWMQMGTPIDESIWFPCYVIAARMGGPSILPFDFGLKLGYLPNTTLWGSLKYNMLTYGVDINYALPLFDDTNTTLTVGVGLDGYEGDISGTLATNVILNGVTVASGIPAHTVWSSITYKFKVNVGQPILESPMSLFAGLQLGSTTNTIGVKLGDVNSPDSKYMCDLTAVSVFGHVGLGLKIYEWHFDMSAMINFAATLDLGFTIGVRYQLG